MKDVYTTPMLLFGLEPEPDDPGIDISDSCGGTGSHADEGE